jgi:replicative DNA helicase
VTAPTVNGHDPGAGHTVLEPGRTPDVLLAEKHVLGSAIRSRPVAEGVTEMLPATDYFGSAVHRAVFAAVRYLAEETADDICEATVLARLVSAEHGIWRTGQAGVVLADFVRYATPSWEFHAGRVLKAAVRRRGLLAADQARQMLAESDEDDLADTAERVRGLFDAALGLAPATGGTVTAAEMYYEAVERLSSGEAPGTVELPWADMRDLLGPLRPGQLVTIAARPSLGKSVAGQDIARRAAIRNGIPTILFTMEQDRDEVMDRLLAAEAEVELNRITNGGLEQADWDRIAKAAERFDASKLVIDDTPRISLGHIRARLRGMARKEPAQLAIVDYLQLMDGVEGESRQREVAAAVGGLKAIAREFRIPVVMLCQLNRGPESRHDKRPYISDARESGAVENDSDVAILIHRPDHYDPESKRSGEADFIVDKNRNGRRATITVGFQGYHARFVDLAWSPAHALENS